MILEIDSKYFSNVDIKLYIYYLENIQHQDMGYLSIHPACNPSLYDQFHKISWLNPERISNVLGYHDPSYRVNLWCNSYFFHIVLLRICMIYKFLDTYYLNAQLIYVNRKKI